MEGKDRCIIRLSDTQTKKHVLQDLDSALLAVGFRGNYDRNLTQIILKSHSLVLFSNLATFPPPIKYSRQAYKAEPTDLHFQKSNHICDGLYSKMSIPTMIQKREHTQLDIWDTIARGGIGPLGPVLLRRVRIGFRRASYAEVMRAGLGSVAGFETCVRNAYLG